MMTIDDSQSWLKTRKRIEKPRIRKVMHKNGWMKKDFWCCYSQEMQNTGDGDTPVQAYISFLRNNKLSFFGDWDEALGF